MASYIATIAEQLKTHLSGGSYVVAATVERRAIPYFDRKSIGTSRKVCVVPNDATQVQFTRSKRSHEIAIEVFVQAAIDWENLTEFDQVTELAEQVNDRCPLLPQISYGSEKANWIASTFEPFYVPEHMTELRMFTSRIINRYAMVK